MLVSRSVKINVYLWPAPLVAYGEFRLAEDLPMRFVSEHLSPDRFPSFWPCYVCWRGLCATHLIVLASETRFARIALESARFFFSSIGSWSLLSQSVYRELRESRCRSLPNCLPSSLLTRKTSRSFHASRMIDFRRRPNVQSRVPFAGLQTETAGAEKRSFSGQICPSEFAGQIIGLDGDFSPRNDRVAFAVARNTFHTPDIVVFRCEMEFNPGPRCRKMQYDKIEKERPRASTKWYSRTPRRNISTTSKRPCSTRSCL